MIDESRQRLVRKGLRCRLFLDFILLSVYVLLMTLCKNIIYDIESVAVKYAP